MHLKWKWYDINTNKLKTVKPTTEILTEDVQQYTFSQAPFSLSEQKR